MMQIGIASFNVPETTRPADNLGNESLARRLVLWERMQDLGQPLLVLLVTLPFSLDVDVVQQHQRQVSS